MEVKLTQILNIAQEVVLNARLRKMLTMVTVVILTLFAPATASANEPAGTASEKTLHHSEIAQRKASTAQEYRTLPVTGKNSGKSDCTEVRRNLKKLREAGQKQAVCFEWKTPKNRAPRKGVTAPSVVDDAVWCTSIGKNQVYLTRNSICSAHDVIMLVVDTATDIILGKAYGLLEQEIDTKNTSTEFSEYMKFTLVESDVIADLITVRVEATCSLDKSCKQDTEPWGTPRPITVGTSIDGTWTRSWTDNTGNKPFLITYDLVVEIAGSIATTGWGGDKEQFDGQFYVRCDNEVSKYAGCVAPDFTPTFEISDEYYAARAFIGATQENMSTHPGWENHGKPLHRESSAEEEEDNRKVICKDGSFTANPDTPDATCDEYPFARSKESGRNFGVTSGAECQQYWVEAEMIGGQEYLILFNNGDDVPASAKCGRASMPSSHNTGVGGELGRKTVKWRLLENDPYWVDAGASDES
ncbi:hypothetical protein ABZ820_05190 [Streptomyces diacarni]|uniref:hypothetical protein n=1 Tax=Streptomyces diacarni TaxID=2800381 RepID=UPI0033ED8DCF